MVSCGRQSGSQSGEKQAESDPVLAYVGKEQITVSQFQAELASRSHGFAQAYNTPERRAAVLEEMVRRKAALQKAHAEGFDSDPQTAALVEQLVASRYIETRLGKYSIDELTVTDAEVKQFYDGNADAYRIPAAVRCGAIWLKLGSKADPEKRQELEAWAKQIQKEAGSLDANGFARLVQQRSDDQSTRYIAGDTGWIKEGESSPRWPEAMVQAAFSLVQPGTVSPVIKTAAGFYILRLTERREAAVRPLAEVSENIRYQLQQVKRQQREQAFFGELKSGLDIRINQQVLDALPVPDSTATAAVPKLPGG